MMKLQSAILEISAVLYDVMKYSAELDCLISMAVIAHEFKLIKPEMMTDGTLSIKKGRHLLQELCLGSFMPNDTVASATNGKIKILTGPNGSGKSIYLKQVALIVYMAHIGSFVPAEQAKIPLINEIFTRILAVESVSINMSRFYLELAQISKALNCATEKSLVLVDEFGKGTQSRSGLALLTAAVNFWVQKGALCPYVILATHIHSLDIHLIVSNLLCFQTMEVMLEKDEVINLFKVIKGKASDSFAHLIAYQAGFSQKIIARKVEVSEKTKQCQSILPRNPSAVEKLYECCDLVTEDFLLLSPEKETLSSFLSRTRQIRQQYTPNANQSTKSS